MKLIGQIASLVFVMVFLISSTGIVIIKSNCTCSGNKQVSLYVSPETCEDTYHNNHSEDLWEHHSEESSSGCHNCNSHHSEANHAEGDENSCNACSNHLDDCGCASPETLFFKLKNQFDEEVRYFVTQPIELVVFANEIKTHFEEFSDSDEIETHYIDPPPKVTSSLDFLIQIQQLKIPHIA
ncbi:MAG: hypothetical protein ABFS16_12800 [Bacteroidota bacterium]